MRELSDTALTALQQYSSQLAAGPQHGSSRHPLAWASRVGRGTAGVAQVCNGRGYQHQWLPAIHPQSTPHHTVCKYKCTGGYETYLHALHIGLRANYHNLSECYLNSRTPQVGSY